MRLTLLGTGGPRPDPQRHAAATLLQIGDDALLFDTGRGVVLQSVRAGIALENVHPIFLTHHHYDHIGDLADVILTGWMLGRERPLKIFGPPGTTAIVNAWLQQIYDKDIAFRVHEQKRSWPPVEVTDVLSGLVYDSGSWKVFTEMVVHGHGLDFPSALKQRWVCLGYRVEAAGKVVTISGDCIACAGLDVLAREATVLVQCCYLACAEITTPALHSLARDTLACADTVGQIARQARVQQLVLTHFRQKPDEVLQEILNDVAHDYDGPVVLGRDLTTVLV